MNDLNDDIEWELAWFKEDLDDIFADAEHEIRKGFGSVKQTIRMWANQDDRAKKSKYLDAVGNCLLSKGYDPVKTHIIILLLKTVIFDNCDEGFSYIKCRDPWRKRTLFALKEIADRDWSYVELLKALDDQHCQKYR